MSVLDVGVQLSMAEGRARQAKEAMMRPSQPVPMNNPLQQADSELDKKNLEINTKIHQVLVQILNKGKGAEVIPLGL